MKPGYASISRLLCGAVLVSTVAGCSTAREQADEGSRYLYPGMSMEEVSERLGEPNQVIKGEPGAETTWVYRFEGNVSAGMVVVSVVLFVAIVALAVASKSGGGGGSFGGGGGSDGPPCQLRLRFDPEGRLINFTTPEPVPGAAAPPP
jgi:hypothetical protein